VIRSVGRRIDGDADESAAVALEAFNVDLRLAHRQRPDRSRTAEGGHRPRTPSPERSDRPGLRALRVEPVFGNTKFKLPLRLLPTPPQNRLPLRMAPHQRHPQPPEAPHRPPSRLKRVTRGSAPQFCRQPDRRPPARPGEPAAITQRPPRVAALRGLPYRRCDGPWPGREVTEVRGGFPRMPRARIRRMLL
jgi:hypothetical protein